MVKKSFWLEEKDATYIQKWAKKAKITESAFLRGMLADFKTAQYLSDKDLPFTVKEYKKLPAPTEVSKGKIHEKRQIQTHQVR